MKKTFIYISTILTCFGALFASIVGAPDKKVEQADSDSYRMLKEIDARYCGAVYLALYSAPEFKATSIIQLDKTARMYNNEWISPATYADLLNQDEKKTLLRKTGAYLENIKNKDGKLALFAKLKRWCAAQSQMNMLCDKLGVSRQALLKSFDDSPVSEDIIADYKSNQNAGEGELDEKNYERAYFAVIDRLSEMDSREQFEFYSKLYKNLSCVAKY
jgi:DNA-binding phage protein